MPLNNFSFTKSIKSKTTSFASKVKLANSTPAVIKSWADFASPKILMQPQSYTSLFPKFQFTDSFVKQFATLEKKSNSVEIERLRNKIRDLRLQHFAQALLWKNQDSILSNFYVSTDIRWNNYKKAMQDLTAYLANATNYKYTANENDKIAFEQLNATIKHIIASLDRTLPNAAFVSRKINLGSSFSNLTKREINSLTNLFRAVEDIDHDNIYKVKEAFCLHLMDSSMHSLTKDEIKDIHLVINRLLELTQCIKNLSQFEKYIHSTHETEKEIIKIETEIEKLKMSNSLGKPL